MPQAKGKCKQSPRSLLASVRAVDGNLKSHILEKTMLSRTGSIWYYIICSTIYVVHIFEASLMYPLSLAKEVSLPLLVANLVDGPTTYVSARMQKITSNYSEHRSAGKLRAEGRGRSRSETDTLKLWRPRRLPCIVCSV
jgi:hypothetical protein